MTLNPISVKVDNTPRRQVAFKGVGNPVIIIMDSITRGGFAAAFITQDMLGMAVPRTAAGLTRNSDDTGKKNTAYAKLVMIREFLSGPSSFMIPAAILYGVKKKFGRANDVPINYIKGFSDDFKTFASNRPELLNKPQELKMLYYKHGVKNLIENSTVDKNGKKLLSGIELDTKVEKMANMLVEMDNAPKKHFWNTKSKNSPKYAKDFKAEFVEEFVNLRKKYSDNPSNKINTAWFKSQDPILNSGFESDKLIKGNVDRFVNHIRNYTNDLTGSMAKKFRSGDSIKKFVDNFCHKRVGSRFVANISMTGAIIAFCTVIPKLYNSKDGKNPALAGLQIETAPPKSSKEVK